MSAHFVLKSGTWPDADAHLCRPLIGGRKGRPDGVPWLAVATGHAGGQFALVGRDGLSRHDAGALIAEAKVHAATPKVEWQVTERSGFLMFKKPSQVRAIVHQPPGATPDPMDDLSAELLVSAAALAGASEVLHSSDLIAVVPKRGWLLVVAGVPGELPKMMAMNQIAAGVHGRAAADAISPCAFFVKEGGLVGANVVEGSGGFIQLDTPQSEAWFEG